MTARVLVVDDLEPNVKLLEAKLRAEYFEVMTALSGQEAIDLAIEHQPDIVLLDVMMPGLDGFETCKILKANDETWHIPVVMVTALDQQADRVAGLQAGADDFLTKPVQDIALFARVRSLTRFKQMTDELRHRHAAGARMGVLSKADLSAFDEKQATILVVTDEDSIPAIDQGSEHMPKHISVVYENDARMALEAIRRGEPDLVFIDLGMESYDPLRLCSGIRAFDTTRMAPILAIASKDETRQLVRALDLGVSDYLMTPIDAQELAARVRTQIRRMRYLEQLRASFDQTMEMAIIDQLTGLYNRRFLSNQGTRLIEEAHTTEEPLAALMVDIDHFKMVNDTYGHDAGDLVLKEVSARLTTSVRGSDLACRTGGEEFAILMPRTPKESAHDIADRVLRAVNSVTVKLSDGQTLDVTVSIGVASLDRSDNLATILKRADEALYRAKQNGRNQVIDEAA
ncbi:PleD family two-component system response regulator [Parvularcula sp. ZS-1/3]|uniref:diguanylate cyclase n=1 Tax=Parvularcula mediterranea TaxID=2732508 RepID=A0A7Y3RME0_9PROT|nr:PleD family two-component system response regulator [Parvularcula mediterranea]NNU16684.1 PleD family two-component system response regulator [Parvularcula mediterranea]